MKTYQISTPINAPADRIWRVLTEALPKDPAPFGILRIDGAIAAQSRIKLWSDIAPDRAFSLRVIEYHPPQHMVWRGGMPFGLFTGTRSFRLSPHADGTLFEMQEVFSGVFSGKIVKSMPDLTPSFEKFAQALKERAERDE